MRVLPQQLTVKWTRVLIDILYWNRIRLSGKLQIYMQAASTDGEIQGRAGNLDNGGLIFVVWYRTPREVELGAFLLQSYTSVLIRADTTSLDGSVE